jgi:hypothetical protein
MEVVSGPKSERADGMTFADVSKVVLQFVERPRNLMSEEDENDKNEKSYDRLDENEIKHELVLGSLDDLLGFRSSRTYDGEKIINNNWIDESRNNNDRADDKAEL